MTGPSSDSLVVAPEDEDVQPLDSLEGAGLASSLADLTEVGEARDPIGIVAAGAGVGLDALGFVADPLGALGEAGIGWLIEHVWFLHEPLDVLAGDPTQIVAQAQTWQNVATQLDAVAVEYRTRAAALPGWDGEAGDAYRSAVAGYTQRLGAVSIGAEQLAQLVLTTGSMVGAERALIRDAIAEFVWNVVVPEVLAGLAALVATSGVSLAVVLNWVAVQCTLLAADLARRIARLLAALDAAGDQTARIATGLRNLSRLPARAAPIAERLDRTPAGASVELAKQDLGFRRDLQDDVPA